MDRALKRRLETRFGERLLGPVRQRHDETEIRLAPGDLPDVMRTLHDEPEFRFEAPDGPVRRRHRPGHAGPSTTCGASTTGDWLRVIADGLSRDDPRVPSVIFLWKGAEWQEREAYDMFGIRFEGNRDLRRIYMPPDYTSFPLRKDFFLPDDAARSAGGGVRHMEQTQAPTNADRRTARSGGRAEPGAGR